MIKLLAASIIALGILGTLYADPSETGVEHGKRLGWERNGQDFQIHSVPDSGNTLALLSLGMGALAFWKRRDFLKA